MHYRGWTSEIQCRVKQARHKENIHCHYTYKVQKQTKLNS